jgi:aryl sulfotransferase
MGDARFGWLVDDIIRLMADPAVELAPAGHSCKRQLPQPLGTWSGHVSSWMEQREVPILVSRYEELQRDPHAGLRAAAGFRERRPESTAPFFRRGVAGDWRGSLSASQQGRIVNDHREMMERFRYLS